MNLMCYMIRRIAKRILLVDLNHRVLSCAEHGH